MRMITGAIVGVLALLSFASCGAEWEWKQCNGPYFGEGRIFITPAHPEVIYASGLNLFRSEDRGETWEQVMLPIPGGEHAERATVSFSALDPEAVFCAASKYGFVSHDRGKSWELLCTAEDVIESLQQDPYDRDRFYLVYRLMGDVVTGALLVSSDGCKSFEETDLLETVEPKMLAFHPKKKGLISFLGEDAYEEYVYVSEDSGETWVTVDPPKAGDEESELETVAQSLDPDDPEVIYVATRDRRTKNVQYWYTLDLGKTWEIFYSKETSAEMTPGVRKKLKTVFPRQMILEGCSRKVIGYNPAEPKIVYLGLWKGAGGRSEDGGQTWKKIINGFGYGTPSVVIPSGCKESMVFCEIQNDVFVMSNDLGRTWKEIQCNQVSGFRFLACHPTIPGFLVMAGRRSISKSGDLGEAWERIPLDCSANRPRAILFDREDANSFKVLGFRRLSETKDGGQTWTHEEIDPVHESSSMCCSYGERTVAMMMRGKTVVVVDTNGTQVRYTPNGEKIHVRALCCDDGSRMAVETDTELLVSKDSGKTWEKLSERKADKKLAAICFSSSKDGLLLTLENNGETVAYDLESGVATTVVHAEPRGAGFCRFVSLGISPVSGIIWAGRDRQGMWTMDKRIGDIQKEKGEPK